MGLLLATVAVPSLSGQTPFRALESPNIPQGLVDAPAPAPAPTPTPKPPLPDLPSAWWEDGEQPNSTPAPDFASMQPRRWTLSGGLTAGVEYDDNVRLAASGPGKISSAFYTVQPSVGVKYGPMGSGLSFDLKYTADMEYYDNSAIKDAVNQSLSSAINWDFGRFRLTGSFKFAALNTSDVETGGQVVRNTLAGNLGLTYDYSDKTSFGVTYATSIFAPKNTALYIGSVSQTFGTFADYKITGKTTLGLGGEYENQQVDRGNALKAYRLLLRSTWAATEKLTLHFITGPELRSYTNGPSGLSAYWRGGIDYKFLDTGKTTFAFDIYRNQAPSTALINQSYTATGTAGTFAYHPFVRLQMSAAIGYEDSAYMGTAPGVTANRVDNAYFFRPGLTYAIRRWSSVSVFYQWTRNTSTGNGAVNFQRNNFGVMLNFVY